MRDERPFDFLRRIASALTGTITRRPKDMRLLAFCPYARPYVVGVLLPLEVTSDKSIYQ